MKFKQLTSILAVTLLTITPALSHANLRNPCSEFLAWCKQDPRIKTTTCDKPYNKCLTWWEDGEQTLEKQRKIHAQFNVKTKGKMIEISRLK